MLLLFWENGQQEDQKQQQHIRKQDLKMENTYFYDVHQCTNAAVFINTRQCIIKR